jgi:1-acyl-sn-glycerol-3-phosphate acyltransferase
MIDFFKNVLRLLWRIWFYILFTGLVFLFAPILLIITSRETWYPIFFKIAGFWARTTLFCTGFWIKKEFSQKTEKGKSYMFIANHTSILDVLLMLAVIKNPFVFVGKKELSKIPVFGFFYRRTCILVDRSNAKSKHKVFKEAQRKIDLGLSICIFPEGMVPDDESIILSEFKKGAFKLAIEHELPIVPLSFYDCKKRFSYTFFSGMPGVLRVKMHSFVSTIGLSIKDISRLQGDCFDLIEKDLISKSKIV